MAQSVRTFVAIELPGRVRRYLARCQDHLRTTGADVKWTRPDQIHLTLAFLGNVPATDLPDLAEAVREAVSGFGPLRLRAMGTGRFPTGGPPRVVWAGVAVEAGDLEGLQRAVARAVAPFAQRQEHRPFHPHLTLGRVRSGRGRGVEGLQRLGEAVLRSAKQQGPVFEASEVVIFQSELSPAGPTYTALARIDLPAEPL